MPRNPKQIEIETFVNDGKLTKNRDLITDAISQFEGKQITLVLKRYFKKRTDKENRYYWGVIIEHWVSIIRDQWGEIWGKEDVHHFLKSNLNFDEVIDEGTGIILRKPKSTTENTTFQQEEYHEACRQLAYNMFEYHIPLPEKPIKAIF